MNLPPLILLALGRGLRAGWRVGHSSRARVLAWRMKSGYMASFANCPLAGTGITRTINVTNDRHRSRQTLVTAVHAAIPNTQYFDLRRPGGPTPSASPRRAPAALLTRRSERCPARPGH